MTLLAQLFQEMTPTVFLVWSAVVGVGVLIAVIYFVVRRRQCASHGHDFVEIDAVPRVTVFRCRRCGVRKHESKNAA
jgi:hypothetical protein